jgi:5,10-methylene-tetrahydrofolate dehydrogenase/methenyl tetrahydrofolate cyclohydrolase
MAQQSTDTRSIHSNGIYHGLPTFGDDVTGRSAIVVGASGMSGQSMIDILVQSPERWKTIYALSRRPPQLSQESAQVKHVPTDLLKDSDSIGQTLKDNNVQA